jgi:dUTPase
MSQQQKNQHIQVPAVMLGVYGLMDQRHILKSNAKQNLYPFDAGIDLFPCSIGTITEYVGWSEVIVNTGFNLVFPPATFGFITDRSSTAKSTDGGTVLPGIIDATYKGEILVRMRMFHPRINIMNVENQVMTGIKRCIEQQVAIAQIIPLQCLKGVMKVMTTPEYDNLTGRGNNGFGSTNQPNGK